MAFRARTIPTVVRVYEIIYLILLLLALVGVITDMTRLPETAGTLLYDLIQFGIGTCLYHGLHYRTPWLPTVITAIAGFTFFVLLFAPGLDSTTHLPAAKSILMAILAIRIISELWQLFTLYFFTRSEVRAYFNARHITLL